MTNCPVLRVSCYAGYRGEETPTQFAFGERVVDVAEVLERWTTPDNRYFKCKGSDGDIYLLRYDALHARWELDAVPAGFGAS